MLDTPLTDLKLFNKIEGLYLEGIKPTLFHKYSCVKEFINFLKDREQLEQLSKSNDMKQICSPFMPIVESSGIVDFNRINNLLQKHSMED